MTSNLELWLAAAVALVIPLGAAVHAVWMALKAQKRARETWKRLGFPEQDSIV